MAIFGLACEGITDQIVIQNILCGFYKDYKELDGEIIPFEPLRDETNRKQEENSGGWTRLLTYLGESRFQDDVLNSEYTIIQIDTDISDEVGFNAFKGTLSPQELIHKVKERLIAQIDSIKPFYEAYHEKIIFAISVHSLECWILPLYKDLKKEKIVGCFETLQRESKSIKVIKEYNRYDKLSEPLRENKKLLQIATKNSSLQNFIHALPKTL
jgi:hypothetical protein